MKTTLPSLALLALTLFACKLPFGNDKETPPAPAAPAATAVPALPVFVTAQPVVSAAPAATAAPVASALTDYSAEGLVALPENCVDSQVVLGAVPKNFYASDTFGWRHVRQVALANPRFKFVRNLNKTAIAGEVAFTVNEHKPTKGVALVAHCGTAKTCLDFAAAYRTVVPTAKPTLLCGANPNIGKRILGGENVLPDSGKIADVLPDKKDVQSQCVRLAACKAARDFRLETDEAQACMMKPSQFKLNCARKKSCEQVLSCSGS